MLTDKPKARKTKFFAYARAARTLTNVLLRFYLKKVYP